MITIPDIAGTGREVQCRKVLIKLGSAVVMDRDHRVDVKAIESIVDGIAELRRRHVDVILVTSGSIGIGGNVMKRAHPKTLPEKQALAAIGQISLMHTYQEILGSRGMTAAQLLLSRGDMEDRRRYLNARYTLERLLRMGAVPIINENDTTATDEISFGDNDMLAAYVAVKMTAELLLLLSSVDGVYETPPKGKRRGKILGVVEKVDERIYGMVDNGRSIHGRGGMRSKLDAAKLARAAGVHTIVAGGKRPGLIQDVMTGRFTGTYFPPVNKRPISARARWIGFSRPSRGHRLTLDAGAVEAIAKRKASLLAVGVVGVEGKFERGDVVELTDAEGHTLARGLVNYSSAQIEKLMGHKTSEIPKILGARSYDEIVHRDNLALIGGD